MAKIFGIIAAVMIFLAVIPGVLAATISPTNPTTTESLTCNIANPSQYVFQWYRGATYLDQGQTLSSSYTARDQTITCNVYVNLFGDLIIADTTNIVILNTAPTAPTVSFIGDPYYANSTLTVNATSTDVDNDALTYSYEFSRNGTLLQNSTSNTYDCTGTCTRANVIDVVVYAFDGTDYSTSSGTNQTTILNSAPYGATVTVTPGSVYVGTQVNASGNASDIDSGDTLTYTYQFYNYNSSTVVQAYSATSTYTVALSDAHDIITVYVNATDGFDSTIGETNITILNTAPSWSIGNFSFNQDTNLTVNLSLYSSDADNDSLTYFNDSSPDNITISFSGSEVTFVPDASFDGVRAVNLTVSDGMANTTQEITLTVVDTNPQVSSVGLTPSTAYTNDTLNCTFTLLDYQETALTAFYTWFNNSAPALSGSTAATNDTATSIYLDFANTTKGENWTCEIVPFDGTVNGTALNSSGIVILNTAPTVTTIPDQNWAQNTNQTINMSLYFSDIDNDDLNFSAVAPTNFTIYIDNSTNIITLEPDATFIGTGTINFTAFDNENANVTSNNVNLGVGLSNVINSFINETFYSGDLWYSNITGIVISTINVSNVTGAVIDVLDSTIYNSTVVNSSVNNCTISDSYVENAPCLNAIIDPSSVISSNTTGSQIYDSVIHYSNFTNSFANNSIILNSSIDGSTVINSNLTNVTATNSYVIDSELLNTVLANANVTAGVLYNGTMLMANGSTYNASAGGAQNLTSLVNYAPVPVISSPTNGSAHYTGTTITFTSGTTDANIGGLLNDSLTYVWDFGDGSANATTENATHSYAAAGTYTVTLTVGDNYGEVDATTISLSLSVYSSGGSGGGGGRSGGGSLLGQRISLADNKLMLLGLGEYVIFDFGGEDHTVTVEGVYSTFVKVKVESDPVYAVISENETAKFDLNKDGYFDLGLALEGFSSTKAYLKFNLIFEEVPTDETEEAEETTEETVEEVEEVEEKKGRFDFLTGRVSAAWDKVSDSAQSLWDKLKSFLKSTWDRAKFNQTKVVEEVEEEAVDEEEADDGESLWDKFKERLKAGWNKVKSIMTSRVDLTKTKEFVSNNKLYVGLGVGIAALVVAVFLILKFKKGLLLKLAKKLKRKH